MEINSTMFPVRVGNCEASKGYKLLLLQLCRITFRIMNSRSATWAHVKSVQVHFRNFITLLGNEAMRKTRL